MTNSPLSAVVLASSSGPGLIATLDAIACQTARPRDVTVVFGSAGPSPSPLVLGALERMAATATHVDSWLPGAMRNGGVRRTTGRFLSWLDAGDLPAPMWVELALEAISRDALDFVAPLVSKGGADQFPSVVVPAADLADLLTSSDRVPVGAVVRRDAWSSVGGFDDTLPALEEYDFWIRLMARGCRGRRLERLLVARSFQTSSIATQDGSVDPVEQAAGRLATRHHALFARDPASSIIARVRDRAHLDDQYVALMERRKALVAELDHNVQEIQALEAFLQQHGRDALDWGDLRAVTPVSADWGYDRGVPLDRVYIEEFVGEWAQDIRGRVLEVQESDLTRRFGNERITHSDVIDINAGNTRATILGDLRRAAHVPSDAFDCFILTQTLHVIDDMPAVLRETYRILKPGGVVLATLPCASRVCLEYGPAGDFWRVTEAGARALFETVFAADHIQTRAYGNVLSNLAFLLGLASHELSAEELASFDPYFPLLIGVRAVKPAERRVAASVSIPADRDETGTVLLYHRVAEPDVDVHGLAVPPRLFRQHLEHLRATRIVMPLEDVVRAAERGSLPRRALAITFDDGYRDNLQVAAPLLVELGMPATFFLTTQAFDGRTEYWWDALERALFLTKDLPDRLELTVNGELVVIGTSTLSDRTQAYHRLHERLVSAALAERDECLFEVLRWAGVAATSSLAPILTPHEVQQLARLPGCTIGTHTANHLALGCQPLSTVAQELHGSQSALMSLVGRPITALAYPYGDYRPETVVAAKAAGIEIAVTCDTRRVGGTDRLGVPRVEVKTWSVAELDRRISARPLGQGV